MKIRGKRYTICMKNCCKQYLTFFKDARKSMQTAGDRLKYYYIAPFRLEALLPQAKNAGDAHLFKALQLYAGNFS